MCGKEELGVSKIIKKYKWDCCLVPWELCDYADPLQSLNYTTFDSEIIDWKTDITSY